jgi:hypothetical protein
MGEPKPKQAQRNAGAFIGPDILAPVPMRTLSDDYHDVPAEPEDSDRVPPPEPRGRIQRFLDRISATLTRP